MLIVYSVFKDSWAGWLGGLFFRLGYVLGVLLWPGRSNGGLKVRLNGILYKIGFCGGVLRGCGQGYKKTVPQGVRSGCFASVICVGIYFLFLTYFSSHM